MSPESGPRGRAAVPEDAPAAVDGAASVGLIGQTIGGYRILAYLGEGRWGSVFAALQTSINRPVESVTTRGVAAVFDPASLSSTRWA